MGQIKNSFDPVTRRKIIKGFLWGLLSALSAGLTSYATSKNLEQAIIIGASAFTSSLANAVVEYMKGENQHEDGNTNN